MDNIENMQNSEKDNILENKSLIGIDPSFRALSYSLFDGKNKIYMDTLTTKLGSKMGFESIFHATQEQWKKFYKSLKTTGCFPGITEIVSEIPPPIGAFSAGLYGLDVYVLHNLWDTCKAENLFVLPPSFLTSVHGTRKYKKKESTELANYIISNLLPKEIEIIIPDSIGKTGRHTKGKLNNDKAESFIFLMRLFCKFNILNLKEILIKDIPSLNREPEKILCSREKR